MLKEIEGMPADVLAVEATGEISHEDYRERLILRAEAMMGLVSVRTLYVIGQDFTGFDLRAMADDAGFGFRHPHDFSQIAVVSDHIGLNTIISLFKPLFHGEVQIFGLADVNQAKDWIKGGKP